MLLNVDENIFDKRSYRIDSSKFISRFNYRPKKTIKDAIVEIKKAYDQGMFRDGISNNSYYDVRTLNEKLKSNN